MAGVRHWEQDKDSTIYVGNIAEEITDKLIWELFVQAGPVVNVHLPKDRVTQTHQGYGFVEFAGEQDADYAVKCMNQTRLKGKPIRVNKASADRRGGQAGQDGGLGGGLGVGAELFVGGLDSMVDEKTLYDTFARFGPLVAAPKVARDDTNLSKGYGFISYASFDASDDAIANMHGQYLMNKEIVVQYAFKKDGKGERHGDAAERALAAQAKKNNVEPEMAVMPAGFSTPQNAPTGPAAMSNGGGYGGAVAPPTPNQPNPYNNYYGGYPGYGAQNPYAAQQPAYNAYQPQAPAGMPGYPPQQPYGYAGSPVGTMNPYSAPPSNFGPPPMANNYGPPRNQAFTPNSLQAPIGAGLPPRPPPSNGGYGGPPPPGMPGQQQNHY